MEGDIDALWMRGELRAACDASARAIAASAHPFRDRGDDDDDDLAMAARWHDHGHRCWQLARFDEAADALDRAYTTRRAQLGAAHIDTLTTLERLAALAHYTNDLDAADARWREAIGKLDDTGGPRGLRTAIARRNYSAFLRAEDPKAARREIERALHFFRRELADDDLEYFAARKANAMLAFRERAYPDAVRIAAEAIEHCPLADEHPFVAAAKLVGARAIAGLRDGGAARPIVDDAIAAFERGYGDHPLLAIALSFAGRLSGDNGELEVARVQHERAFAMYRRFYPTSPTTRAMRAALHQILIALGDRDAAANLDEIP